MQSTLFRVLFLVSIGFAPALSTAQELVEEIVVVGRAQEFYLQTEPSLGNKFPGDLREIPQSIQILPPQLIKDQAAVEITDLYRNISSVSVFSYSGVTFRGFRQDEIRYDGLLGDPFSGFSVPLLWDIQQVEVIKGPSGALFGNGEPGGLINYVTKRPGDQLSATGSVVAGNYDLYGVRADVSGPVNDAGTLLFRLGGAFEETDPFRFNTNKKDTIFATDFEWRNTEDSAFLLRYDYVDQDFGGARLRGVPAEDDGEFLTTRRFNTNEDSDFQRLEAHALTLNYDHRLTEALTLALAARLVDSEERQNYHENRGLFEDDDGVTFARREFRNQRRDIEQRSFLGELVYDARWGNTEHTLLFGGEYYERENQDFFLTSSDSRRTGTLPPDFIVPDLNFFEPDYGSSGLATAPFVETDRTVNFDQWSIYLQDQIRFTERLLVAIGGRYEGFSDDTDSVQTILITGAENPSTADQSDEAFTIRTGVVYDILETVAAYFNYSTGFQPQTASNQNEETGGPFDPEESQLLELGTKIDLFNDAIYAQMAIYEIEKTNVLVADPTPGAPTGALTTIGKARARGFEVDIVGDITDSWTFTFSYGYNDTVILEGPDEIRNAVGDEFANAPDHQLGFWTRYDINAINSAIAFGGEYVSEQISLSGQRVKPYTIFDASWVTTWRNVQLQLNVRNLFDKEYAESGFLERTGHFPGDPRQVRAEIALFL